MLVHALHAVIRAQSCLNAVYAKPGNWLHGLMRPTRVRHDHAAADKSFYTAPVGICTSSGTSSDPQGLGS